MVKHTQKGSGLVVQFKSGKTKRLSATFEFIGPTLEEISVGMNHYLHTETQ